MVRTHLAIIAQLNTGPGLTLQREIDLVKAALLYADTIEILSPGRQLVQVFQEFAAGEPRALWQLIASLDDSTLRSLHPDTGPATMRAAVTLLAAGAAGENQTEVDQFARGQMEPMKAAAEDLRRSSGAADLEHVMDAGLVRFNRDLSMFDAAGENDVTSFVTEFIRYLRDPSKFLLLDDFMAKMATNLVKEGHVSPPARVLSNAGEASLGTGFISRLPAFTHAPLDELVDLRTDLGDPLTRYRAKVAALRGQLQTGPFDGDISTEVDALWRQEVEPSLLGLREAMADHTLVREGLRGAAMNLGDFVKGIATPAALAVAVGTAMDLTTVVTAGMTTAAVTAPVAAKTALARHDARTSARRHDLFYLYELDRRLS